MDNLLVTAAAEEDYTEAFLWYAARSKRAANGLEAEFAMAIAEISQHPTRFPAVDPSHRFYLLKRYPYQVIYRETVDHHWLVVAFAHTSREPGYWHHREHG